MSQAQRITLALFVGAVFALYWPALEVLFVLWNDTDATIYTHGWLIAALMFWLLWRPGPAAKTAPTHDELRTRAFLGVALGAVVIAWQLAYRAGIQFGYLHLLPLIAWLAVRLALGREAGRRALFPLLFIYFAMPLWDLLIPLAHAGTVHAVRLMLRVVGVPAYFEGDIVQLPAGAFAIEEGCSGLHFIIVALAVGALMGELRRDGWRLRLRWLAIALLLAIVSNWLRVFIIVLLGHFTHMQHYLVRVSHYWFGWALFLVAVMALFLSARRAVLPDPAPRPGPGEPAPTRWRWANAALATAIVAIPVLLNPIIRHRATADLDGVIPSPQLPAEWRQVAVDGAWEPVQVGADLERRWRFTNGREELDIFVATYREQAQRKKLGGLANRPTGDAAVLEQELVTAGGRRYAAQHIEQQGRHSLLWLRYQVADRSFVSATGAQLWYSLVALTTLSSPPSSVWAIRAPCQPDCDAANSMLTRTVTQGGGSL